IQGCGGAGSTQRRLAAHGGALTAQDPMAEQSVDRLPSSGEAVAHAWEIQQPGQRVDRSGGRAGEWWRHAARLAAVPAPRRRRATAASDAATLSRHPGGEHGGEAGRDGYADPRQTLRRIFRQRVGPEPGRWSSRDDQRSQAQVTVADAGHRLCDKNGPAQGRPSGRSAVTETSDATLSNLLHEKRRFEPPKELAEAANVKADAYE